MCELSRYTMLAGTYIGGNDVVFVFDVVCAACVDADRVAGNAKSLDATCDAYSAIMRRKVVGLDC